MTQNNMPQVVHCAPPGIRQALWQESTALWVASLHAEARPGPKKGKVPQRSQNDWESIERQTERRAVRKGFQKLRRD